MAIDPIYQRITFVDANGKLTREAIRLLEQIGTTGNTVQNISNTTVMQGQASAFDDIPQRDITREIINALLQTGDTPRPVDTDVAGNVDWSSPQAPADLLAGIVLADTPAPIQLDPLASAILNDTPQPIQVDPLSNLALFDTGCWDQAGAAAALLTSNNTWTGTNSYSAAGPLQVIAGGSTIPSMTSALVAGEIHALGAGGANDAGFLRLSSGGGTTLSAKAAIDIQGFGSTDTSQIRFYAAGVEKMRLANSGNVLIGTTTDNGTDKLQVSGTLNVSSGAVIGGKITSYNGVSTIGAGVPSLIKTIDLTAQAAEIGSTVLYAVPASGAGLYRVSMYNIVTRAATTSSTLPAAVANWTDFDSSTSSGVWVSGQSTGNYVGANGAGNSYMFYAKASTNITYNTSGYASVGGTSMQFSLHIRLEYLG